MRKLPICTVRCPPPMPIAGAQYPRPTSGAQYPRPTSPAQTPGVQPPQRKRPKRL